MKIFGIVLFLFALVVLVSTAAFITPIVYKVPFVLGAGIVLYSLIYEIYDTEKKDSL